MRLLLESAFALDSEFGGHGCDGGCRSRCGFGGFAVLVCDLPKRFLDVRLT